VSVVYVVGSGRARIFDRKTSSRPRIERAPRNEVSGTMAALPPILIVDDEADDLYILRRLLAKAEVRNKVIGFEDPLAAVDYLQRECENPNPLFIPCAIITDLNMPGRDGVEFTQWIRRQPVLAETRIIMITDSESPSDETRATQAGVSCFVRKFPTAQRLGVLLASLPCVAED
jgi:CheY-like chemotaxis protein